LNRLQQRQLEKRGFIRGFAAALAQVAREHGEDAIAGYILADSGYTLADFEAAQVDDYDLDVLRPLLAVNVNGTSGLKSHVRLG
jgi:predicted ATP-grasp superfamily ATP-dependent carboligase